MKHGILVALALALAPACDDDDGGDTEPRWEIDIGPEDLATAVDNPLLPLAVGTSWQYESHTEEDLEVIEVEVLAETELVWGVTATVVRDQVYVDDELVEDTFDWFAQDGDGNVWYLGEDSCEIEDDDCVDRSGSWEAGIQGALPGIAMLAVPEVGDHYYQEFLIGEAEDEARVVAVDVAVHTQVGSFSDCVTTEDSTRLEPGAVELKTYCPGVGLVVELGDSTVELVQFSGL